MTDEQGSQSRQAGLEMLAKVRATMDLQDRERLDSALRAVRLAARDRAQAARHEGRTDPDELRAEIRELAAVLRDAVRDAETTEDVMAGLESVAVAWRENEGGAGDREVKENTHVPAETGAQNYPGGG